MIMVELMAAAMRGRWPQTQRHLCLVGEGRGWGWGVSPLANVISDVWNYTLLASRFVRWLQL